MNCISCYRYIDRKNTIGICRICRRCNVCGGYISSHSLQGRCKKCLGKSIFGDKNPNWKESGLTYEAIHRWVWKYYGKAHKCEGIECTNKNPAHYEWANISGEYKKDIKDWKQLCPSCHKKFDYRRKHNNCCKYGHKYTSENTYIRNNGIRECRTCINKRNKK